MDFITELLARFFKSFRVKSPIVATVLLLILSSLSYTAAQGSLLGLYALPTWASQAIAAVSAFLAAVTAPEVYPTLSKAAKV